MTPFSYEEINLAAGLNKPSTQKSYNNETFAYWAKALFERAMYSIKIDFPPEWDNRRAAVFYWWLFICGHVGIFRTPEMGTVFSWGTLYGYDFYYQPRKYIVTNPYADDQTGEHWELEIDKDCALVTLTPDMKGIGDLIAYYADKLANLSLSLDLSIINTRFAKIIGARNKAAAETLKKVLDKVNSGQPAVIVDEKLLDDRTDKASPFQIFGIDNLKENYITDKQIDDLRRVLMDFETEVGIPTYDKKERLVTYEAEHRRIECIPRITVWIDNLNKSLSVANELFGLNMRASIREEVAD